MRVDLIACANEVSIHEIVHLNAALRQTEMVRVKLKVAQGYCKFICTLVVCSCSAVMASELAQDKL